MATVVLSGARLSTSTQLNGLVTCGKMFFEMLSLKEIRNGSMCSHAQKICCAFIFQKLLKTLIYQSNINVHVTTYMNITQYTPQKY